MIMIDEVRSISEALAEVLPQSAELSILVVLPNNAKATISGHLLVLH